MSKAANKNKNEGLMTMMYLKKFLPVQVVARRLVCATMLSSMLVCTPVHSEEETKWSDNRFLKAIYFDRSIKQRSLIIGGTAVGLCTAAYLLYKVITRTPWEKNLIALDEIEHAAKRHYWHRVKTEEVDSNGSVLSFTGLLKEFLKHNDNLTLLSPDEKLQLLDKMITTANEIHDLRIPREKLVKTCEVEFFGFIKKLRTKIIEQQQVELNKTNKSKKSDV